MCASSRWKESTLCLFVSLFVAARRATRDAGCSQAASVARKSPAQHETRQHERQTPQRRISLWLVWFQFVLFHLHPEHAGCKVELAPVMKTPIYAIGFANNDDHVFFCFHRQIPRELGVYDFSALENPFSNFRHGGGVCCCSLQKQPKADRSGNS